LRLLKEEKTVISTILRNNFITSALTLLLLSACATTSNVKQVDRLDAVEEDPVILIMTPDVKYYLLTAGGVSQPHAEWTEAAKKNFSTALQEYAKERNINIITPPIDRQLDDTEVMYQKLYSAVGTSILIHHFGAMKLPTKQGSFDWSLGQGTQAIADKYGADYALFSYYRDYQASEGRVAFAVLAAVAGVGISTGYEAGFASLVDLRTGDIVWFNQVTIGAGELRHEDGARATIDVLFKDMPEG
jgi:hypothetical protein